MAQQFNESQRLQALEAYNPAEHLTDIKSRDGTMKKYLPAAYRFYELNLRYSNANFSTEIVFMDLDHDFVIVRARLYLGASYDLSEKKAEALKQGKLSQLDRVDTAAKARCARDMGIGTEYALEFSDEDITPGTPAHASTTESLATIKEEVKTLGLVRNPQQWASWKKTVLGKDIPDNKMAAAHVSKLAAAIEKSKAA